MSLAQGNNTPTRPRIEPGSPDPEFDALTTRPVHSPQIISDFAFATLTTRPVRSPQIISDFAFATYIVQYIYFLNPKFQASSYAQCPYSSVYVGPGRKPRRHFFLDAAYSAMTLPMFVIFQALFLGNRKLKDNRTLADYNIWTNANTVLKLRIRI